MAKKKTTKKTAAQQKAKDESIAQDQVEDQQLEADQVEDAPFALPDELSPQLAREVEVRAATIARDLVSRELRSALVVRGLIRRYGIEEDTAKHILETVIAPIESQLDKLIA